MNLPTGFDTPVQIGQGSFGTVLRVRQKQLDRQVVIKMIPVRGKNIRSNYFKEAVTQAQLHLPCLPQVYDVFMWKKRVCIVMQWIRSVNLQCCISIDLDIQMRLSVADMVFQAVKSLHERGFVHRDLKPGNILVTPEDGIFLIDFGFSAKTGDFSQEQGIIKGTSGYIAPEIMDNVQGENDFFRADCYSLGIILNEILGFGNKYSLLKSMIDVDPKKRPKNAVEAYFLWKEQTKDDEFIWYPSIIDEVVREKISILLIQGINLLIKQGKYNEAYRLCLESVQETPDKPEALSILNAFGKTRYKNNLRIKLVFATITVVAGIIGAVLYLVMFQRNHELNDSASAAVVYSPQNVYKVESDIKKDNLAVCYRYHPSETPSLSGCVYFGGSKINTAVYINGKLIGRQEKENSYLQCNLSPGSYRVSFQDEQGYLITSEEITVLPFTHMYIKAMEVSMH